jgi:hypothetical protein
MYKPHTRRKLRPSRESLRMHETTLVPAQRSHTTDNECQRPTDVDGPCGLGRQCFPRQRQPMGERIRTTRKRHQRCETRHVGYRRHQKRRHDAPVPIARPRHCHQEPQRHHHCYQVPHRPDHLGSSCPTKGSRREYAQPDGHPGRSRYRENRPLREPVRAVAAAGLAAAVEYMDQGESNVCASGVPVILPIKSELT